MIDLNAWCAGRPMHPRATRIGQRHGARGLLRQGWEISMLAPSRGLLARANLMARDIWNRAVAACAVGVGNLVMTFSPGTVVVGGGVGRQEDFFAALHAMVVSRPAHHPKELCIVPSSLGDVAGLAGAAGWMAATSCSFEWE